MRLYYQQGVYALLRGFFVAVILCLFAGSARPQTGTDARPQILEMQKAIARELRGGDLQEYQLSVEAGQYAHIMIDQKSIDVGFSTFGPDGKLISEGNISAAGDVESIAFIAEASGQYRIQVSAGDKAAFTGEYAITLTELRQSTETDKSGIAGAQAMAAGMVLYREQKADARYAAIAKFQEAVEHWRAAKNLPEECRALGTIGFTYKDLGEKQKAFDFLNQAIQVARAAGDKFGEGWALNYLGYTYDNFGDKKKSLETFEQALQLWHDIDYPDGLMRTLNGLGTSHAWLGDRPQALDYFQQALVICRKIHNRMVEATLLGNIAYIHGDMGNYQKELDLEEEVVAIQKQLNNRTGEAIAYNNTGAAYSSLGDYQKAMDSYTAAFNIAHEMGVPQDEAIDLNNIAWIYSTTGDYENALKYYGRSVEILRKANDTWRLAQSLTNLGATYADLRQYEKALDIYRESLVLHRKEGHRSSEANTLNNMAYAYGKLGDLEKSLDYYLQSLAILRETKSPSLLAQSLRNLGAIYRLRGEHEKALEYLNESMQISKSTHERRGEAETLGQIAHVELDQGKLTEALNDSKESLGQFDSLRKTITNPRLRAWFSQAGRKVRETNLQTLVRLHQQQPAAGYDAAALMAAEKSRAQALLELLGESQTKIRERVDPALLEREASLRQTIANKARLQQRLLDDKHTEEEATAAAREIDGLTHEYDQLQGTIREKSPAYAALTTPDALSLQDIRKKIVDEETMLLEYSLGNDKSFLFAITPQSFHIYELPKRETVETAARKVYDLLTAHNQTVPGEKAQQRAIRLRRAEADYPEAAAELSRMVLGPAASQFGAKRFLIVGEGALLYVPFHALPDPASKTGGQAQPLMVEHEIVTTPSASVLSLIRDDIAHRQSPEKLLAILADPVFDRDDPRIARHRIVAKPAMPTDKPADVTRSGVESGLQHFERLRFSRQEAEKIARLAPGAEKFTALDFAANRATATSHDLARYRIVHFATHGIINNQHPELTGLVLSLVNDKGDPIDGFLRLYDIYNLKLGADLVVLSACQTALGKEMAGEGLVGLTRGFVFAGAPRVVASLWQIDDRATAELMTNFYQGMLIRHERPAAALRAAQLAMWKTRGWESPYYWAAFTLQGEWK